MLTDRQKTAIWATLAVTAMVVWAFVTHPALFSYYGDSLDQCVLMYTPSAATTTQAEIALNACRNLYLSP